MKVSEIKGLKLIYLHQYFVFPEDAGGTRSFDLATSFVKNGASVEVITSSAYMNDDNLKNGWNLLERDGLKIHVLKSNYSNDFSTLKRMISFVKFLIFSTFKLFSLKSDLVLATSTPLTIGVPALIKNTFHKTPYIFEVRDVWPEVVVAIGAIKNGVAIKVLYWLEKLIYKRSSGIVPLSIDMKKSIESRYPKIAMDKPIEIIENISEIERFSIDENKEENIESFIGFSPRFTILYAGTFGKVNGITYIVDLAFETLVIDPELVYVLVGNGAEREAVINYAKTKGVFGENLFIIPPIAKKKLPILYSAVDMGSSFVIEIEELWANSANKFFDTLAAGKPVLINHRGWQADIIEKEKVGYVLPCTLEKQGVEKFIDYTKNYEAYLECQKNAKNLSQRFSLESAVQKYSTLIELIIRNKDL